VKPSGEQGADVANIVALALRSTSTVRKRSASISTLD
jgi:hypothetical protein